MKSKTIAIGLVVLVTTLAGCVTSIEETTTPEGDESFAPVVSVTGEIVPESWATVSAQTGGTVLEVLVEPGDSVAEGDVLVKLDPTDAQLAMRRAETVLQAAQAQLALLLADPQPEEIAAADAQVQLAQAAVSQTAAQRDQVKSGVTEAEIAAAQAQVTTTQADQLVAQETHDQTMKCYGFTAPDGSEQEICPLLGPIEEQARRSLQATIEQLDAAQAQLDALVAGADDRVRAVEAAVCAAAARLDIAQAQLDLLQAGATAEEVAATDAVVTQAQAALDAAQVALERTEVRAPVAGTVAMVDVRMGELVVPGQSLITIGDLSTLRVETTDLDEIDVARVAVGQQVDVTFDALPEYVLTGHVRRISPMAEPGAGGINYTAIVELDEIDPAIRWGMTAFVDIEVDR